MPSINAIYSDDRSEVVKDDRVVGLWKPTDEKKSNDRYRVQAAEKPRKADTKSEPPAERETCYKLTLEDAQGNPKKNAQFEMRVVRLGANDFIDIFPSGSDTRDLGDRFGMSAIPTHIIMPIKIKDDHVVAQPLDLGKVKTLLAESPGMTPHAVRDGDVVILTGSPRQVQEFFRRIGGENEVFADAIELQRIGDADQGLSPAPEQPAAKPGRAGPRAGPRRDRRTR
ncbi:MAG: hypothetical protein IT438_13560 [Phycisphaerales bacterium]|nr:hypothetical protein [Phycisphaerales bacterium]